MEKFILKSRAFWGMAGPVIGVAIKSFGLPLEATNQINTGVAALFTLAGVASYLYHFFKPDGAVAVVRPNER